MQVTAGNQLRIENPSEQLLTWCKKQLILPNPEYAKKVRMHFWVGNTPEKLYLFQWDGDTLVLPYGCLNDVLAMDDCHMKVNLPTPTEVDFGCTIPLYDYQVEAKEALITAYGGAKYATNGVPDEGANTMIKRCKDATASGWDKVDPGEVVWTTGHIGVYIGNGLAVECSPRWANNVQITAVGNIGKKNGYNTRMWKKHGHLPYVIYDKTVTPAQPEMVKPVPTTEVKAKGVARSFNKAVAGTYTVTAGAGLNVRDAAGTDSRVLVTIPKGTTVKNYGYYTVVNGVKWLYVAFSHKRVNYTGFVHERFLSR